MFIFLFNSFDSPFNAMFCSMIKKAKFTIHNTLVTEHLIVRSGKSILLSGYPFHQASRSDTSELVLAFSKC